MSLNLKSVWGLFAGSSMVAKIGMIGGGTLVLGSLAAGYWVLSLWILGVVLVVLLSLWLVNKLVRSSQGKREKMFDQAVGGAESDDRDEFKQRWQLGMAELNATGTSRYDLGFYMLIGEPASGKTTTLRQSGLNFPIGMEAIRGTGGTKNCDWWFTDDAIILDTAGRLTFHDDQDTDPKSWKFFMDLLKRYRPECPINGVVVTIPCTSLLQDNEVEQERKAEVIRNALVEIQQNLEIQFPVYVLITKADLIGGFAEFFGGLTAVEQLQLLGWSRPAKRFKEPFAREEVHEAVEHLVARMRRARFAVLNECKTEETQARAEAAFPFPDELEAIKKPLQNYLGTILPDSRLLEPLFFQGFYLTSGLQHGVPVLQASEAILGEGIQYEGPQLAEDRALFIRDFYKKKLFKEQGLVFPTRTRVAKTRMIQRFGYGGAIALLVLGGAWVTWSAVQVSAETVAPNNTLRNINSYSTPADANQWNATWLEYGKVGQLYEKVENGDFKIEPDLGFASFTTAELETNLARLQRQLFVRLMRGGFAKAILDTIGKLPNESYGELDRSHQAFDVFVAGMAEQSGAVPIDPDTTEAEPNRAAMPPTILPLLNLTVELSKGVSTLVTKDHAEKLDKAYRGLLARDVLNDAETRWKGTGLGIAWTEANVGDAKAALTAGIARIREGWENFLIPDDVSSAKSTELEKPHETLRRWCQISVVHKDMDQSLGQLREFVKKYGKGSVRGSLIETWRKEFGSGEQALGKRKAELEDLTGRKKIDDWAGSDGCLQKIRDRVLESDFKRWLAFAMPSADVLGVPGHEKIRDAEQGVRSDFSSCEGYLSTLAKSVESDWLYLKNEEGSVELVFSDAPFKVYVDTNELVKLFDGTETWAESLKLTSSVKRQALDIGKRFQRTDKLITPELDETTKALRKDFRKKVVEKSAQALGSLLAAWSEKLPSKDAEDPTTTSSDRELLEDPETVLLNWMQPMLKWSDATVKDPEERKAFERQVEDSSKEYVKWYQGHVAGEGDLVEAVRTAVRSVDVGPIDKLYRRAIKILGATPEARSSAIVDNILNHHRVEIYRDQLLGNKDKDESAAALAGHVDDIGAQKSQLENLLVAWGTFGALSAEKRIAPLLQAPETCKPRIEGLRELTAWDNAKKPELNRAIGQLATRLFEQIHVDVRDEMRRRWNDEIVGRLNVTLPPPDDGSVVDTNKLNQLFSEGALGSFWKDFGSVLGPVDAKLDLGLDQTLIQPPPNVSKSLSAIQAWKKFFVGDGEWQKKTKPNVMKITAYARIPEGVVDSVKVQIKYARGASPDPVLLRTNTRRDLEIEARIRNDLRITLIPVDDAGNERTGDKVFTGVLALYNIAKDAILDPGKPKDRKHWLYKFKFPDGEAPIQITFANPVPKDDQTVELDSNAVWPKKAK